MAVRHRFAGAWSVVPFVVVAALLLGGSMVIGWGDDLYPAFAVTSQGLPFTYPPFAGVMFVPAALAGIKASVT